MTSARRFAAAAIAIGFFFTFTRSILASEVRVGDLIIKQSWSRATPSGSSVGAWYLEIFNSGDKTDRIVGGSVPVARSIEIHETKVSEGIARMRPVTGGLVIKPRSTMKLEPGATHIMLVGLKDQLKEGQNFRGTLIFANAGTVEFEIVVQALGARAPTQHQH